MYVKHTGKTPPSLGTTLQGHLSLSTPRPIFTPLDVEAWRCGYTRRSAERTRPVFRPTEPTWRSAERCNMAQRLEEGVMSLVHATNDGPFRN